MMGTKQSGLAALTCLAATAREVALDVAKDSEVLDDVLGLAQVRASAPRARSRWCWCWCWC